MTLPFPFSESDNLGFEIFGMLPFRSPNPRERAHESVEVTNGYTRGAL